MYYLIVIGFFTITYIIHTEIITLIIMIQTDINVDHNVGSELTDHRLDYSILGSIDHDTNYLSFTKQLDCQYYTENEFNKIPNLANNFSLY